ncbi:thioredoxin family protein [Antiquaquibacter soli]|uniref:Thioredoxin family protein n=1 Tax=Antiquaquibacter soli TaxID=3064523 RepID=A0ABT9BMV8_9MICO|nr:thioredoxin family protein [Protaetiibacter sp. WY-16]MDO7882364.1 thioredoxin family protein [Protaetiibacter sp. WY-16]
MDVRFFSSAFCEPCMSTRAVLAEAVRLVPAAHVEELDVARHSAQAEAAGIRSTPTVVVLDDSQREVFRAEGAPTLQQVLVALAKAV